MPQPHKGEDVAIITRTLSVIVAAHRLVSTWDLPPELKGYFDFIARNAATLNRERDEVDSLPEETELEQNAKKKALRNNVWSKARPGTFWSIDGLTQATIHLVWTSLIVARHVNRLRVQMGRNAVNFYDLAAEYDREQDDRPETEV